MGGGRVWVISLAYKSTEAHGYCSIGFSYLCEEHCPIWARITRHRDPASKCQANGRRPPKECRIKPTT